MCETSSISRLYFLTFPSLSTREQHNFTIFTHAQKFLQRNQTFPQTYLILILCTPSLGEKIFFCFNIFISFITIFFSFWNLGVQISPLFFFTTTISLSTLYLQYTFTFDNHTNPHYNEMSIISRSRQFMVFRAKRVKSNVGFKRKLSWFFIIRLKEGASGNDFMGWL